MEKYVLNDWLFSKEEKKYKWLKAAVPGTVHTDLLNNKIIDEPFYNDNEIKTAWIQSSDWTYKTIFDFPDEFTRTKKTFLVFEGIDTIASVLLNGKMILNAKNMFIKYDVDISKRLKEKGNELVVKFKSPLEYGRKQEKKHGKLPVALNSERAYIRKAQYSFGWDWGPSFPTSGIWRPVYIIQKNKMTIHNIAFDTIKIHKNSADVVVRYDLDVIERVKNPAVKITLSLGSEKIEFYEAIKDKTSHKHELKIKNPKLWWPSGEGEQNLYSLKIEALNENDSLIDAVEKKVGLKTVSLQLKEKNKNTFRLIINGKPVFAKGTNWIPADSFLPRVSKEKYYALLKLAKDSNQNIIRVWGGGIYENDQFYEICDELGLMVWHDFMFACGSYPEHKEFIENVKEEVTQNVKRLRHHPCISIWCGNNENEWLWYQATNGSYKKMPGHKIYAKIIPEILKKTDSHRPYWQSSPFSAEDDPNSQSSGNRHQWQIWSMWVDYNGVANDKSLFVTEFGFQGAADISTFEKFISKEHRTVQSRIFEFHNKQVEGPERVNRFLSAHLPLKTEWEDYIYLTQLNQSFALKRCLEHWRKREPETNGSIIWQLNDCWPVTSWAIVDSELKPKMSWHFVKQAFSQNFLFYSDENKSFVYRNNGGGNINGKINIRIIDISSGKTITNVVKKIDVKKDKDIVIDCKYVNDTADDKIIIASLLNDKEELINRNYYLNTEWKYVKTEAAEIEIKITEEDEDKLIVNVKSDKPAYFVDLYHPEITFSERGFILMPSDKIKLKGIKNSLVNIKEAEIKIFQLNKYLQI